MAQIPDAALQDMLQQLPRETARSLAHIVTGKISHQVRCLSEDVYAMVDEPVLDDEGNQVFDEDGQPIVESVRQLQRLGCKGEVIAYLYADGAGPDGRQRYRVAPVVKPDGTMKLHSSRPRLDGQLGFECACRNDSRLARQELGHIQYDGTAPTREGLEAIYRALQKDPADYPEIEGLKVVDGFQIERVSP